MDTTQMYENFETLYPVPIEGIHVQEQESIRFSPYLPYFPGMRPYIDLFNPWLVAIEYTDWRDETLAWHLTCCLSASLNPAPTTIVRGPDAARFLKAALINNIDKFPVGTSKHGIMCTQDGFVATHGVLMRTGEDVYETQYLSPYLDHAFTQGEYDATLENISDKRFILQFVGPRTLEVLEEVCEDNLHDIKFCRFRNSSVDGKEVRILRFGMAGGLGYEIQGDVADVRDVYMKIIKVGNKYGIRRMGSQAYILGHTPGGNIQAGLHFLPAAFSDPGFVRMIAPDARGDSDEFGVTKMFVPTGSAGTDDIAKRYATPFDLGLQKLIDWDKGDFQGREALLPLRENPKRTIVTLLWNAEDIGDVHASQFRDEEPYFPFDYPGRKMSAMHNNMEVSTDMVLGADGQEIGLSGGRTESYFHRAMLSLAIIDRDKAALGTEVSILWGDPGSRQKTIRAKVAPFPFNTNHENRTFDVSTIPAPQYNRKA
jgi:vanillate/3-O-methylgallate O-demethylase